MVSDGIKSSAKRWCRMAVSNMLDNGITEEYDSDQTSYRVEFEGRERLGKGEYSVFLVHLENELQAGMPVGTYRVKRRVTPFKGSQSRWRYEKV